MNDLREDEEPELCTCLWCQGSTPLETVVGECCWSEWKHQISDLSMLVKRFAHAIRRVDPDNEMAKQAADYLKRHNLQGSILRGK